MIAELLSKNASRDLVDDLTAAAESMDRHIQNNDFSSFFPTNLEFHQLLLEATGNARLKEIFLVLFKELRLFRIRSLLSDQNDQDAMTAYNLASNAGHKSIIEAVQSGDASRIELELRRQVIASRQRSFTAFERSAAGAASK